LPVGLIKPFVLALDPETAHELSIATLRTAGVLLPAKGPLPDTPVEVMGLEFPNRIGLAAGLDKNGEAIDGLAAWGFGHIEVGTVTPRPQPGNPKPRLFRLPEVEGIINRMGFNNRGIDALITNVRAAKYQGILGINIGKNADTPIERAADDYLIGLEKAYPHASYVTVNISSPNTKNLRQLQGESELDALLAALKARQAVLAQQHGKYVPLVLKIAPDLDDMQIVHIADALRPYEVEAFITDWVDDTFGLWWKANNYEASPERSPEGRLQLVLPKIQPALDKWLALQAQAPSPEQTTRALAQVLHEAGVKASPLEGVLVLSTDRGDKDQEPIATFTFLKRWLKQKGVPEDAVQEFVYLHPGERLESHDSPIDPTIARRLERALLDFYPRDRRPPLLIACIGGLPLIKDLLAEIAGLLAGSRAHNLFKTEQGVHGLLPLTPIDALRVRRQCLALVQRGALLDAWAMATPFHQEPEASRWVRPLGQAAQLLNGNPVDRRVDLAPLKDIIERARTTSCLLVAIRVETALLNARWLEAINGSLIFLEAAFHDALRAWADRARVKYEPRRRYMRFCEPPPSVLLEKTEEGRPALEPWKGVDPLAYRVNMVGENALSAWDKVLGKASIGRLRQAIHDHVRLVNGQRFKLADYRNFNTHGVMTQEEIDEAIVHFMGADLWSQGVNNPAARPKPGKCFLGRGLVAEVIDELSPASVSAQALYQALLAALEERLIAP
jgi:dihydroorotate dehydrogenase